MGAASTPSCLTRPPPARDRKEGASTQSSQGGVTGGQREASSEQAGARAGTGAGGGETGEARPPSPTGSGPCRGKAGGLRNARPHAETPETVMPPATYWGACHALGCRLPLWPLWAAQNGVGESKQGHAEEASQPADTRGSPGRESAVGLPTRSGQPLALPQQPTPPRGSGPPGPGPSPACWRSPSPELRGPEAPQAPPCHQARRRPWGWGAGDGWAGCIPVFFAELGVGFSDIQAFTEHCFTTAGTKRENRVTDAAPPGGPGGRTSAQLHTSWAWPTWPQARHTGTRGGQAGERRGHSAPHPSDLLGGGGGAGQALEDAQHPPPALGPLQPQLVARWGPVPSGQARKSSGAWSGSGRLGGAGKKGLSGDRHRGPPGWSTADPVPAPPTPRQPGLEGRAGPSAWWLPMPGPLLQAGEEGGTWGGQDEVGPMSALGLHGAGRSEEQGQGSGKVGWREVASHPGGLLGRGVPTTSRMRGTVRAGAQPAETFLPATLTSAPVPEPTGSGPWWSGASPSPWGRPGTTERAMTTSQ